MLYVITILRYSDLISGTVGTQLSKHVGTRKWNVWITEHHRKLYYMFIGERVSPTLIMRMEIGDIYIYSVVHIN